MACSLVLSFRRDLSIVELSEEQAQITSAFGKVTVSDLTPGRWAVLRALAGAGATKDELSDMVFERDGAFALPAFYFDLGRWERLTLLCTSLVCGGRRLLTLTSMTQAFQLDPAPAEAGTRYQLSRFAYTRRNGAELVLESPLSLARIALHDSIAARLIGELSAGRSADELSQEIDGLSLDAGRAFLGMLAGAGFAGELTAEGRLDEDDDATLRQWDFHDLVFHSRSRRGRHDYMVGGTYRFVEALAPQPALKPPPVTDETIDLYRPDMERLMEEDLPLTRVQEQRRSIRAYGERPITAEQLGEFLYRVARVRWINEAEPPATPYQTTSRPYPTGGASYDLELYLTVNTCEGIASGLYYYDPLAHQLDKLADRNAHVEALLRDAWISAAQLCMPQVLITVASRFQRLSWKYSHMAYATTLKNVGVLYQTMYLVATSMGLAPCGLGNGDSAQFNEAVGADYLMESSVGEFMLGSRANP